MAYIQSFKEQSWLLPPSIEDLIPEDHVCFLIDSIVDALDYSAFDIKYSGAGHPAYQSTLENYGLKCRIARINGDLSTAVRKQRPSLCAGRARAKTWTPQCK